MLRPVIHAIDLSPPNRIRLYPHNTSLTPHNTSSPYGGAVVLPVPLVLIFLHKAVQEVHCHRALSVRHSPLDGHEEADGEGLVLVGQGDHHELAARPDVQVVRRHRELAMQWWLNKAILRIIK